MKVSSILARLSASSLFKDSFWSLVGNIIGRGLALVAGIIVARFLGKDVYGEYGIVRNTIMSIGVFSSFGLGYTATKFIAEYKINKPEYIRMFLRYALRITFAICGFMALALFASADYVAEVMLSAPHLAFALRILAVLIIFNGLTTTQIGVLSGFGQFKVLAKINSLIGVTTFILTAGLTYMYGLNGALISLLVSQVFNWYLNYRAVSANVPADNSIHSNDPKLLSEILRFSTPVAMQEALYSITTMLSSIMVVKFGSYGDLGMFTAAMQWNAIILFIPGILRNVVLAHLAGANKDEKQHSKIMRDTILINLSVTSVCALVVFIFSKFINSLYGVSFDGLNSLIVVAVLTTIFLSVSNVYSQAFMSKGMNWSMFFIRCFRDLGKLALFIAFVYHTTFSGAASMIYSSLLFSLVTLIIMIIMYNKRKAYENI